MFLLNDLQPILSFTLGDGIVDFELVDVGEMSGGSFEGSVSTCSHSLKLDQKKRKTRPSAIELPDPDIPAMALMNRIRGEKTDTYLLLELQNPPSHNFDVLDLLRGLSVQIGDLLLPASFEVSDFGCSRGVGGEELFRGR